MLTPLWKEIKVRLKPAEKAEIKRILGKDKIRSNKALFREAEALVDMLDQSARQRQYALRVAERKRMVPRPAETLLRRQITMLVDRLRSAGERLAVAGPDAREAGRGAAERVGGDGPRTGGRDGLFGARTLIDPPRRGRKASREEEVLDYVLAASAEAAEALAQEPARLNRLNDARGAATSPSHPASAAAQRRRRAVEGNSSRRMWRGGREPRVDRASERAERSVRPVFGRAPGATAQPDARRHRRGGGGVASARRGGRAARDDLSTRLCLEEESRLQSETFQAAGRAAPSMQELRSLEGKTSGSRATRPRRRAARGARRASPAPGRRAGSSADVGVEGGRGQHDGGRGRPARRRASERAWRRVSAPASWRPSA